MLRPIPALILISALVPLAGFASGFAPGGTWHAGLGIATVGAAAGPGLAVVWLGAIGRRIEALAGGSGLPDWVGAQAEKNRAKAAIYLGWGVVLAGIAGGTGWVGGGRAHLGASASALAFLLGSVPGLILTVATQARLLREVRGWAGS